MVFAAKKDHYHTKLRKFIDEITYTCAKID